jgi:hypothetical protein
MLTDSNHRPRTAAQLETHRKGVPQPRHLRARSIDRSTKATVRWHAKLCVERGWCGGTVQGVLRETRCI